MTTHEEKTPHPNLRVRAALSVFPLVDESSRGALEHTVLRLMDEAVEHLANAMDNMNETDRRAYRRAMQMLNGKGG